MSALNGKRGKGVALNADVFMDREFLENWLVGDDEEVSYFIDGFDLEDLTFADETVTINGIEEPLIFNGNVYFDKYMNLYLKCEVCSKIHLCDDTRSVGMLPQFERKFVCKDCFESGRVRLMCNSGNPFCEKNSKDYVTPICIDTEKYPSDDISFGKTDFSVIENLYN